VRGRFRRVVTIHDLIYARFPEAHAGLRGKGMRVLVPLAARRSDRVIADSQSTRDDLIALLHLPPARIDVVPLGLGAVKREAPTPEADLRRRFDFGDRPVLLSLSAKRPHKNLLALVDALALIAPGRRPLVVVPGYATWHEQELEQRARQRGVSDDVRLLPWLSGTDLEGLWALAAGFVFPSLYEGFGLPVLEAMSAGCPVIASDAPTLTEIAGDAAIFCDADRPDAFAAAMHRVLCEPGLRDRLRDRGIARAAAFTWNDCATRTLAVYHTMLTSR
jgi:glycosyltransferase involved in cell wall biosynthesis